MPSLPRIRRSRARGGSPVISPAPVVHELTASGLTWVNVVSPDVETAQELAERFGWHPLDVEDIVSKRQRPKVDDYEDEGYLFAVLHFPIYDNQVQRLNAAEIDLFVGHDYVVTIPNRELRPVTRLFARCEDDDELREQLFARGSGRLLYEILDDLFDYCFPILDKIAHKLDGIEDEMFEGKSQEVVRDISNVKQEIISYRKIIKPERSTLRVLERRVEGFLPEDLEDYFDDIVDSAERIWDLLDNYKEVVDGLESTNESVLAHRQNDVLRLLTVISVTLAPADARDRHLRHERRSSPARARTRRSGSSSWRCSRSRPRRSASSAGAAGSRRAPIVTAREVGSTRASGARQAEKRPGPPPHRGPGLLVPPLARGESAEPSREGSRAASGDASCRSIST